MLLVPTIRMILTIPGVVVYIQVTSFILTSFLKGNISLLKLIFSYSWIHSGRWNHDLLEVRSGPIINGHHAYRNIYPIMRSGIFLLHLLFYLQIRKRIETRGLGLLQDLLEHRGHFHHSLLICSIGSTCLQRNLDK